MKVLVFLPEDCDRHNYDDFNAGWAPDMDAMIGKTGTITRGPAAQDAGGFAYKIKFDNGDYWWWDERYMRPADIPEEPVIEIEMSEFEDILR